ncbi:4Fe-4S binding protein [Rhodoblastus sp.]|uniref:4Fe-4S binding protein n=1 Tax=Rhodoblastus sp. TaxID=1962975 RepID=UPI0035B2B25B
MGVFRAGAARAIALAIYLAAISVGATLSAPRSSQSWLSMDAAASTLDRKAIEKYFSSPFSVGERDANLPIWPIFHQSYNGDVLVAYAFESIDFQPIPGFAGTPINMLVAIRPTGEFLSVNIVSQHEPEFVDGLGPEPLLDFVRQYAGKSLRQSIKIAPQGQAPRSDSVAAEINGIAKATVTVRIVNETVIDSALQVARERMGFSKGRDPNRVAHAKADVFEPLNFAQLLERGYVRRLRLNNAEVGKRFAGTDAADTGDQDPRGLFADVYIAEVDVPLIGRNLLGEARWRTLMGQLDGAPAMLVLSSGRWSFMPDSFVPGATPDFISLNQADAPVVWRDFVWRDGIAQFPDGFDPARNDVAILRIAPQAAFDPASPSEFSLRVVREIGQIFPEKIARDFTLGYELPKSLFELPPEDDGKGLASIWASRKINIVILSTGLLVLAVALVRQRALTLSPERFRRFRLSFLAFTLIFIGWWAQAQLSIVWVFGLIKAVKGEGNFSFLLWDPPTLMVAVFTVAALFVWGRGTFCGWLCPFGALQEFAGELAKILHLRQIGLPQRYARLSRVPKFLVLAVTLCTGLFFSSQAERIAEVEPFKTSITLMFFRSAPYVLYAVALLIAGMFHYKFFCRYLCPLGATLSALSFVRQWKWIPRRPECGSPCQQCRVKCRYGAIEKSGEIIYPECFQCLDCVAILDNPKHCVPVVLEQKRARKRAAKQLEAAQ